MIDYLGKYVVKSIIPGEINLLTNGDGVEFSSIPAITGVKTIKADMRIDSSASQLTLIFETQGINDLLMLTIGPVPDDSNIFGMVVHVKGNSTNPSPVVRPYYTIDSYLGQNISLEIVKGTGSVTSVKINNNTLTAKGNGFFSGTDLNFKEFVGLNGMSIWNLEIVGNHKWIGYPYGNTNGAWADTIGINNGTVTGSPGTRNLI